MRTVPGILAFTVRGEAIFIMRAGTRIAIIKEQETKCPCEWNTMHLVRYLPLIYGFLKRLVFFS